ncbi:F420-dependent oxidoreductase [Streptomyces abikoensis]|nr:F420-dependent oxidoreductase [Streptomyces abikoensis]
MAERYPEPFYEPFTTLSWLAGMTTGLRLGTTVLVLPYRHPLPVARMAANLSRLSGGRFVLGAGAGWARQEFDALGIPFTARGSLTDAYLGTLRNARHGQPEEVTALVPVRVGGNSGAGIRRPIRFGDAWHPLRLPLARMRSALTNHALPAFAPRIALRLTTIAVDEPERPAGAGTIEQIPDDLDDLDQLRLLGADIVVLDPYHGDPRETRRPHAAWQALTTVATHWRTPS